MTALYGAISAEQMARITVRPVGVIWAAGDEKRETIIPPPASDAPTFPKTCRVCGHVVAIEAEWNAIPTRRVWPEYELDVAECPGGCKNTLSIEVKP